MDFTEIRRIAITALFSDDMLLDRLVLKGGNALSLVYDLTSPSLSTYPSTTNSTRFDSPKSFSK